MKSFFKYVLATIVGFIIFNVIIGIILVASIGAAISTAKSTKPKVKVESNSILLIKLDGKIVDRGAKNPFNDFSFGSLSFNFNHTMGLNNILKDIDRAAKDKKIKGILLNIGALQTGMATVEEIRNKLQQFKKSGKFIISYDEVYTQKNYYLASVADKVYMLPSGLLEIKGFGVTEMFYKKGMDKFGIQAQVIRHGKFKSAVEPYMLDSMSKPNKIQVHRFIGSMWNLWKQAVSKSRGISTAMIDTIANNLLINKAEDAVKYNFVDSLVYQDQLMKILAKKDGVASIDDLKFISLRKYNVADKKESSLTDYLSKDKIAVIYASGDIVDGEGKSDNIGSTRICKAIREARKDDDVKAIVFRVNSPGGSAMASDVIWREVALAKKAKPVIVSMGDYAASGGYYISCAATKIVADPMTITGSIGVFAVIPNIKKGLNKYLGITTDTAVTNPHADMFTIYRPMSSFEKAVIKSNIESTYHTFITRVANGRHKTLAFIDSIGQGHVWNAVDAKKIGLVDEFGGLQKAIKIAAKTAHLTNYTTESLPKEEPVFQQILKEFGDQVKVEIFGNSISAQTKNLTYWLKDNNTHGVVAKMPYQIISY